MQTTIPITRELLLAGGGHTHALMLRMWGMNPLPGVRVTVVNPLPTAPYSGMLPGFVAGHYRRDELDIDLVKLARFAGARLIPGRVAHIDPDARLARLENGRALPFHVASVDIGITSDMPALPGFSRHAVPAKPLDGFAAKWDAFRAAAGAQEVPVHAAVIGGGVAGVELVLAMAHALRRSGAAAKLSLIDQEDILPGMKPSRLAFFRRTLGEAGVQVIERDAPVEVLADGVRLSSGEILRSDFTVGAAGARAQGWLRDTGLQLDPGGFIAVDEYLRSVNAADIFAVGDCAHMTHAPRPKAGVFAVRQAPVLFHNLRGVLSGGDLRRFRPQADYLKLISLGGQSALADKWGLMWHGPRLWRLKDRIDRKFMDQFRTLRPMRPALPKGPVALGVSEVLGAKPLCGGCGAKVGGKALGRSLARLSEPARADVLSQPGDDAAILRGPDGQTQLISTDHLRAFTNDAALMARIAAVHALGDIWAMGAQAQAALASITLPRLSGELQEQWLDEIMQAAAQVFAASGADIVGGHTSQGAELTIGFTVTGLCPGAPLRKAGAQPGDVLLLTKPIGTGTILAGEMALEADGAWVTGALNVMAQPQHEIAPLLQAAHALSDVTGFGLAGHAAEIARASGVGIRIDIGTVPFLSGAEQLAGRGVRSTLYADNRALVPELEPGDDARAQLLFDPQTAGGLLAAMPPQQAQKVQEAMADMGRDAWVIGICHEGAPRLSL